jgi:hypothetical protein
MWRPFEEDGPTFAYEGRPTVFNSDGLEPGLKNDLEPEIVGTVGVIPFQPVQIE